jgi:hypothetical protein
MRFFTFKRSLRGVNRNQSARIPVDGAVTIRTEEVLRMLRAVLIATSLAAAMPCFAQQVRVINGDIEHVYGHGGELLDDADLQARNQHAWEHTQAEKQLAIERRKVEVEMERLKLQQAALAYAPYSDTPMGDSTYGGWSDGGAFIGSSSLGFFRRGVIRPRIGISQRTGGSPRMGGSRR